MNIFTFNNILGLSILLVVGSFLCFLFIFLANKNQNHKRQGVIQNPAFIANVTHEMRSTLCAIINLSEFNRINEMRIDSLENNIREINAISNHLLSIIDTLLDISHLESSNFVLVNNEFDLTEVLDKTLIIFKKQIENKKLKLFVVNTLKNSIFIGDSVRVGQIFNNLISNAYKYTDKGSIHIELTSEEFEEKTKIKFLVEDTGVGMTKEFLNNYFKPYMRLLNYDNMVNGTGLGTYVVKTIVDSLNGKIVVSSEIGKGTQVFVEFELKNVTNKVNLNKKYTDKLVLIVDDLAINRLIVKNYLNELSIKSVEASSGKEAIEIVKNSMIDLILIDLRMPNMNGYEAVKKIRKLKSGHNIPIIIMSAETRSSFELSKEVYYLKKPIMKESIINLLNQIDINN